jgi:hypothetical protein
MTPAEQVALAQETLGDTRITLAGTIALGDYRRLLKMRSQSFQAAAALGFAAHGGMFPGAYARGAQHARHAAQMLGQLHYAWANMADGEPSPTDRISFNRLASKLLPRIQRELDVAYSAAYTGTEY